MDSAGTFAGKNIYSNAVKWLNEGIPVAGGGNNFDERVFQQERINSLSAQVHTAVLGSSRVISARKKFLHLSENQIFINNGVSGASIEDYLAIMGMYRKKGYLPSAVIIGVDPWVFNINNNQIRWKTARKYYLSTLRAMGAEGNVDVLGWTNWEKYANLLSIAYTRSNIDLLTHPGEPFHPAKDADAELRVLDPDGGQNVPHSVLARTPEEVRRIVRSNIADDVYCLEHFNRINNKEFFESFIAYLIGNRVKVRFLLVPYHPILWKHISSKEKYSLVLKVEEYLQHFAHANNIQVIGSYDPLAAGFDEEHFTDEMHPREYIIEKLFKELEATGGA